MTTVVDARTVIVGVGQGSIDDACDTAELSRAGWDCVGVLRAHAKRQANRGKLQLVEVSQLAHVAHHICHMLGNATHGDVIFFVCTDSDILEAVWDALNVVECPSPYSMH